MTNGEATENKLGILQYSNEIRSAVLIVHGEKAHSCYFSKDAYANMVKDNPYAKNKELLLIPDAVHTDLHKSGGDFQCDI